MKAIIMLEFKDGIIIEGDDLKIQANGMLNEFRVYDGDRCVFYTGLGKVHNARIEGAKEERKGKNNDKRSLFRNYKRGI